MQYHVGGRAFIGHEGMTRWFGRGSPASDSLS